MFRLRPVQPRRLGVLKRRYLLAQFARFPEVLARRRSVVRLAREKVSELWPGVLFPGFSPGLCGVLDPAPSRLAAVVPGPEDRQSPIQRLRGMDIEAGPFNWPDLSFERIRSTARAASRKQFPGSVAAVSGIINVPIWSEEIWARQPA